MWVLGPFAGSLDPSIGVDFSSYYPRSWILLGPVLHPEAVDLTCVAIFAIVGDGLLSRDNFD